MWSATLDKPRPEWGRSCGGSDKARKTRPRPAGISLRLDRTRRPRGRVRTPPGDLDSAYAGSGYADTGLAPALSIRPRLLLSTWRSPSRRPSSATWRRTAWIASPLLDPRLRCRTTSTSSKSVEILLLTHATGCGCIQKGSTYKRCSPRAAFRPSAVSRSSTPGGEIPPIDPTWLFNSQCNLGFDFGVNPEAGQVVTYRMMVQGGEWTPLPGALPATIEGNRITLQVPRAEIAAEAIRFRMTATDSFVCDVVEFPVPALP